MLRNRRKDLRGWWVFIYEKRISEKKRNLRRMLGRLVITGKQLRFELKNSMDAMECHPRFAMTWRSWVWIWRVGGVGCGDAERSGRSME